MASAPARIDALRRRSDFERLLRTAPVRRSEHFLLHFQRHLPGNGNLTVAGKLSTKLEDTRTEPVDNDASPTLTNGPQAEPARQFGMIIPKRHARHAVTRNLLKRQIREVLRRHADSWPPGCWLVRLRLPFDARLFRSAASRPLREAARDELESLLKPPRVTAVTAAARAS